MSRVRGATTWALLIYSLFAMGCGRKAETQISTYGFSNGTSGNQSINGYSAFRKMFQQQGNKTFSAISFSRAMETMDTIVWTPDTVTPPSLANRNVFEKWLADKPGRTVVYIGRDFDASIDYWDHVVNQQTPGKRSRLLREQMLSRVKSMENDLGGVHFARWFLVDTTPTRSRVEGLRGDWAEGIDAKQTEIVTRTELRPVGNWDRTKTILPALLGRSAASSNRSWSPSENRWSQEEMDSMVDEEAELSPETKVLLAADDGRPLVLELTSIAWGDSKIIVLVNGSFTLNGALIAKEHRKLASKVIEQCQRKGRVAFLRTGREGVRGNDGNGSSYSAKGLEMFAYWPLNLIVYQFFFLGIIICFAVFPIFGRPREPPASELSDFGHHIEALGAILMKCRDEGFAKEQISEYFRRVRREPNHPWCIPVSLKSNSPPLAKAEAVIPIEAEVITAEIQEKKN